ncbi:MAG TPA: NusA-like transcription termination signal-binding factor [archaeon]|nr:NusA-like transcription termination signal-binding factor [archaeon]
MQRFDTETLRLMTLFENVTGAPVKDCVVEENTIYYVVDEGKVGMAIGKNGASVHHAEKIAGKTIKLFEFSKELVRFVRNLIPQAREVKIKNDENGTVVEIKIEKKNRAVVIGRDGKNLKLFKELLQRNHNVIDLVIK